MSRALIIAIIFITLPTLAAFKIKPGLWEIETKSQINGESHDMNAKMQEAMKNMKPAQRAQMEKMMGSKGMGFGDKGMKICHTDKTMSDEALVQDKKNDCKITDKKDLSDGVRFNVKCKNGSGTAEYHATNENSYSGWNEFETAKGKSKIDFKGKFLSSNCGNIKPINEVNLPTKTK